MPNPPCAPDPLPDLLRNDPVLEAQRRARVRSGVSRPDYRDLARRFVSDPVLRAFAILAIIAAAAGPSALVQ